MDFSNYLIFLFLNMFCKHNEYKSYIKVPERLHYDDLYNKPTSSSGI